MAFQKPTHITKITYITHKTQKTFETTLGSTFASMYVSPQGMASDKFSGKTFFEVTIDGTVHLIPVTLSAKPVKTERGDAFVLHVNQTDTIGYVSERQVAIADLKTTPAPAAVVSTTPARGVSGAVVRNVSPTPTATGTGTRRTL